MNKRLVSVFWVVVLLALASASSASVGTASAQGPVFGSRLATLSVPQVTTVAVGETVDVPVTIAGVSGLYGIDVQVFYEPTIASAEWIHRGVIPQPDFVLWERVDLPGEAWYVVTQLNPTLPANGGGVVATVRLTGLQEGKGVLHLVAIAATRDGDAIPLRIGDGVLVVSGIADQEAVAFRPPGCADCNR